MSAQRQGALVLLWRGWRVIVPVVVANAVIQAALVGWDATLDRGGLLLVAALASAAAFAAAHGMVASAALEAPGGPVRWRAVWHRLRRHGLRYATWALGLLLVLSLAMTLNDLAALVLVGATAVLPIAALDDRGSPPAALLRTIRRHPWRWLALALLTAVILGVGIVVSGFTVFFLRGALAAFIVWLIGGLLVSWLTVVWARTYRDAWDVVEASDSAAEVTATPGDAVWG